MNRGGHGKHGGEVRLWTSAEECAALAVECAHPHRIEALLRFARETAPAGRETPFSSDKPTTPVDAADVAQLSALPSETQQHNQTTTRET